MFLCQKRTPFKPINGPFHFLLQLGEHCRKPLMDADNRLKAPLDFCAKMGLIANDKHQQQGHFGWYRLDCDCRITFWGIDESQEWLAALTTSMA